MDQNETMENVVDAILAPQHSLQTEERQLNQQHQLRPLQLLLPPKIPKTLFYILGISKFTL